MKTTTAASASALLALAATVNGHLAISSPPPIPGADVKAPLDANGDNFPCHGVSLPGPNPVSMAVGSTQLLAFNTGNGANTATHGGGSCQISITYETDPTAIKDPANWHVLYSIMGGCPTNSPANLVGTYMGTNGKTYTGDYPCSDPTTNGYDCTNSFNFTIPPGVENGKATLSWTWFNNVGDREIYQNCVAVDITGGESNDSEMSQFPAMFVANLASINNGQCKTTEGENVEFPDPGAYTTTRLLSTRIPVSTAKDYPFLVPSNCGPVVKASTPASAPAANGGASTAAGSTPAAVTATSIAAKNNAPNTLATQVSSSAGALVPPANTGAPSSGGASNNGGSVPTSSAAPIDGGSAPTSAAAAPPSAPTASAGSCAAGSVSCPEPGALVCVDSTHFGICDIGNCAVSQPVSDGTVCANGAIGYAPAGSGMRRRHAAQHTHLARQVEHVRRCA